MVPIDPLSHGLYLRIHKSLLLPRYRMSDAMDKQIQHMTKKDIYSELTDGLFGDRATVKEAKDIVKNIHSRKLYRHLASSSECQTPEEQKEFKRRLTEEMKTKLKVEENDIGFYVSTIHFCKRAGSDPTGSDPLGSGPSTRSKFYDKSGETLSVNEVKEKKQELSRLWINDKQWIHVFYKKDVRLDLDKVKKIVKEIEEEVLFKG